MSNNHQTFAKTMFISLAHTHIHQIFASQQALREKMSFRKLLLTSQEGSVS